MFRLLPLLFLCFSHFAQAQWTTLYEQTFEPGLIDWTLNSGDLGAVGPTGENEWFIGKEYNGGTLIIGGGVDTIEIDSTLSQPSPITDAPRSEYLHTITKTGKGSGVTGAHFLDADAVSTAGGMSGLHFAKQNDGTSTISFDDVYITFWWIHAGSAKTATTLYYSIDGGSTWIVQDSNLYGSPVWTLDTFTNPAWDRVSDLRFAFGFDQSGTDSSDRAVGFGVDEINVVGYYDCLVLIDSVTTSGTVCPADTNGTLRIYASGGSGSLTYSVDSGLSFGGSNNFTNLMAGRYIVVAKDSTCATYDTIIVPGPPPIEVLTGFSGTSTASACDGTATLAVLGGTPPYSYSWDDPDLQTGATAIDLCVGTYICVVTDSLGCAMGSYSVTVSVMTGIDERNESAIQLKPNPTNDLLEIVGLVNEALEWRVFDLNGQLVLSGTQSNEVIDVQSLSPGIHVIELSNDQVVYTKRFVKL